MTRLHPLCLALLLAASPALRAATPAEAAAWLEAKDPRATAAIEALAKASPADPAVRLLEIRLRLQQGRNEDAVDLAEDLVDDAPTLAEAHYWLGNSYGRRIGEVGMLSKATMAPRLRDAFETALRLDPALHEARVSLVEYYLQAPAIVGGSVDKARAQAAELQRRDPPRGHYARGRIAEHEQKPELALEAYVAAHAAQPDSARYRMSAGLAYQAMKRWEPAFAIYEPWTREDPKAAGAWYQLGRIAALSGQRLEQGAAALKRYLTLPQADGQPLPQHAWFRLGQVQAKAGDVVAARASLRKALEIEPDYEDARAELARL